MMGRHEAEAMRQLNQSEIVELLKDSSILRKTWESADLARSIALQAELDYANLMMAYNKKYKLIIKARKKDIEEFSL